MLKMNHVIKNYDGFTLDCSLHVPSGCITGLIGRNGSGKSTTFKSALGLIRVDSGEIELFGKAIKELTNKDKQKLGVALSDSGFSSVLKVQDIICILKNTYDEFDADRFVSLCRRFEIQLNQKISGFSTGMKAKLKLLVTMSHKASLLILDEPTVGLDVVARDELLDLLKGYMEEDDSRSILISSHISSDLEGLCDDIYMIHNGKIVVHEETDILLSDYALLKVNEKQFEELDKKNIVKWKKESWGYSCLTNQKDFYMQRYPDIVLEKGKIDDLIIMMGGTMK